VKLFFDTSALLKKYIDEAGSENVDVLIREATELYVSKLALVESVSALRRLVVERALSERDFSVLRREIETDFTYFEVIGIDDMVLNAAVDVIAKYQLKTLDAIQLASALRVGDRIDALVSCDEKLIACARKEKIRTINPNR
jgi:uncharacterized protein